MSLFKVFDIAGSAMVAQSQRLNVVASNLANADSAAGPDGTAYRARHVLFQTAPVSISPGAPGVQSPIAPATPGVAMPGAGYTVSSSGGAQGVRVSAVVQDDSPGRRVHDPKNPFADKDGYVTMPNVNVVDEMVNMISASRSYQTNAEVMNTAKSMLMRTLQIGQ